jgi:hypothetical protein
MTKFIVGWNMSGYLPESDPAEFDTEEDALSYLREELNAWLDIGDSGTLVQAYVGLAYLDITNESSQWDGTFPVYIYVRDYVYWAEESEIK